MIIFNLYILYNYYIITVMCIYIYIYICGGFIYTLITFSVPMSHVFIDFLLPYLSPGDKICLDFK